MMGGKASTFGPSIKRLVRRMAPYRAKTIAVVALTVVSVLATAVGPRVLDSSHRPDLQRTDRRLPSGISRSRPSRNANGEDKVADMVSGMDLVPGQGVDFDAVGRCSCSCSRCTCCVGRRLAREPPQRRRAGHRAPDARRGRGEGQRAAAELLRPPAAQRAAQSRHQRHRQRQPDPPADAQPAAHLGPDGRRRCCRWCSGSRPCSPSSRWSRCRSRWSYRAGDEEVAGHVRPAVASEQVAQRAHRGDLLRARAGQGVRTPARAERVFAEENDELWKASFSSS